MSSDNKFEVREKSAMKASLAPHIDVVTWRCLTELRKFHGDSVDPADMYDFVSIEGNLLMFGGASALWEALEGNGTATAGQALTYFNNANAAIGVGDSNAVAAATQNALQGATAGVRLRKGMDATYPLHTDGVVDGVDDIVFRSTFATGEANYAWNEWGIFNSVTDATGRMLNRRVESLGTKTSAATWQLTLTLSLGGGI